MGIKVNGVGVAGGGSSSLTSTPISEGITQTAADLRYLRLSGGCMKGILMLAGDPIQVMQAATKGYVDAKIQDLSSSNDFVLSFKGRTGDVIPQIGDYTAAQVGALPITGGTLTGALTLSSNPTSNMQAATKSYVDSSISALSDSLETVTSFNGRSGDVMSQAGDYTAEQVGAIPITGGTLTGALVLSADPTSDLQAATKAYVDTMVSSATSDITSASVLSFNGRQGDVLPETGDYTADQVGALALTGGTLTGLLTLSGDPVAALDAVPKQYVDTTVASAVDGITSDSVLSFNGRQGDVVPEAGDYTADQVGAMDLTGGTLTGPLTLSGDPTESLQAATKQYVDDGIAGAMGSCVLSFNGRQGDVVPTDGDYTAEQVGALAITGGTLTGMLMLSADPVSDLHAATKQYVDSIVASASDSITSDSVLSFNGRQGDVMPAAGDYTAEQVGAVPLSGSTLTGPLTLSGDPTDPLHATTKQYVDNEVSKAMGSCVLSFNGRQGDVTPAAGDYTADQVGALALTGGTLTGLLTLSGEPTNDLHAATKQYVDNKITSNIDDIFIPTKTSDLVNDSTYVTTNEMNTAIQTAIDAAKIIMASDSDVDSMIAEVFG